MATHYFIPDAELAHTSGSYGRLVAVIIYCKLRFTSQMLCVMCSSISYTVGVLCSTFSYWFTTAVVGMTQVSELAVYIFQSSQELISKSSWSDRSVRQV